MQILPQNSQLLFSERKKEYRDLGNKGLLFERFYDGYDEKFSVDKQEDTRSLNELSGKAGDDRQITDAVLRRIQLVNNLDGQFGVFSTDWRFVTGMGHSHPAENGFGWHPVLGTPYLPGSGVKGLLRAWMELYALEGGQEEQRRQLVREWFGGSAKERDSQDQGKAGDLIFFDAIPVECPTVGVDIMTPHMGKWYERGSEGPNAENLPGDWHNPVPITFLVAKEASFLFAIAPRVPDAAEPAMQAMEYLKQALAWLGAGSKTATGYGHMSFDEQKHQGITKAYEDRLKEFSRQREKEARQQELAQLSPIERDIYEFLDQRPDKNEKETSAIIGALKQNRWQGEEKVAVANWLAARMKAENLWKEESKAKKPEKDREYQATLQVKKWMQGE